MAKVLTEGGFAAEALAPMREAVEVALQALNLWQGHDADTPPVLSLIDSVLVQTNLLPAKPCLWSQVCGRISRPGTTFRRLTC